MLEPSLEAARTAAIPAPASYVPNVALSFCIPANPAAQQMQYHTNLNLYKISSSRNIAGLQRTLSSYSVPLDSGTSLPAIGNSGQILFPAVSTPAATPYRFSALIARAQQLTQLAAQMESEMLAALEKADDEAYNLLLANQQLDVTQANAQLAASNVAAAQDGVTLANLQRGSTQYQYNYYSQLLSNGYLPAENQSLKLLSQAAASDTDAARNSRRAAVANGISAAGGAISGAVSGASTGAAIGAIAGPVGIVVGGVLGGLLGGLFGGSSGLAATFSAISSADSLDAATDTAGANMNATLASYERRTQDWQFQQGQAAQNLKIGSQQIVLAADSVSIALQEFGIANLQAQNARDVVNFLAGKFTNEALYAWMGGVLQGIYNFFLQSATAIAKLAQAQLAFERQTTVPAYIQSDYWATPLGATGGVASDTRGLTGAERLLQDITELDALRRRDRPGEATDHQDDLACTHCAGRVRPIPANR